MFTYVLPIVILENKWQVYFKIGEVTFIVDTNTRLSVFPRIWRSIKGCGNYQCDCCLVRDNIIVRCAEKITYIAGKSAVDSVYEAECDDFLVPN